MSLFDQLVSDVVGEIGQRTGQHSAISGALMAMFQGAPGGMNTSGSGGLQALLAQFEEKGLGYIMRSWIGNGPNEPVTPEQIRCVLGDRRVQSLAAQSGMSAEQVLGYLAQILPGFVDRVTPKGQVPPQHQDPTIVRNPSVVPNPFGAASSPDES